ncbi:UNVERIFIED_CONTAM: hypothetical protein Slati_3876200 [Sesamum latifolium]|uniref:Retrotransposon gag domain-containing protein n=1 Tax=Sesamum latifolium TaxID=2727402 RepID=A0AAW2TM70_9LAMI
MASQGGVDIDREGVGVDAPIPPGGAPAVGLPPEFAQILQMALQAQAQAQFLAQTYAPIPAPAPAVATIDRNYERIRKMGAIEFEGTLDPEIAERWWEKVKNVLNLVDCTRENRLKYVISLFVENALIWWGSVKRAYEQKEITWAEFQREFDDKYRRKMYQDKKRMEILNLVQGDDQMVAKYELRFVALAKSGVRITNFKTLVESAVRLEETVIEEKKKEEKKIKLAYKVGESSRSTKRGTGRSFSAGGGNFSRGGPTFWGNSGPRFSGPVGFNRGSIEASSFTMPSIGSDPEFRWKCIQGDPKSKIGNSGRGAERSRDIDRGRGTGNRDGDHIIGGSTIFLFDIEAYVLIDPGSMHSYISSELASKIPDENSPLGYNLMVYLPVGGGMVVNSVRKGSLVRIGDVTLSVDLVVMDLKEFDPKVVFVGERQVVPVCVISTTEARRLMLEGYEAYLAHVIDAEKVNPTLEEIPVVRDFPEVFPDDLPGLPPHREVDFMKETLPGVATSSIAPYRMAPMELHVISGDGVMPDPAKVKAIMEWRVPKNANEVKSFLGPGIIGDSSRASP